MSDRPLTLPLDRAGIVGPLAVLIVATLASTAWQGFDFPVDNNTFHVPILLDYAGSAEGPHDAFHRSLSRWVSVFWHLLAPFASEHNLYAMFLGVQLVGRFFTAFFIWRLGEALGGPSRLSVAFAAVILFLDSFTGRSPLGHNEILEGYLTNSQVVIPIVLGAWLLALRGRHGLAGGVLGLAFNINAFNAVWGALALGILMITVFRHEPLADMVKALARAAGLFLIAAAPTAVWIVHAVGDVPEFEPFSHAQFLRDYYGYHYFIDMMWQEAAFFALTAAAGAVVLIRAAGHWGPRRREGTFALYGAYCAVVAFGAGVNTVVDQRLMFALNPMRMDTYVVILLGVIALAWCIAAFQKDDRTERAAAVIALMALANGNVALMLGAAALNRSLPRAVIARAALAGLWAMLAAAHAGFGLAPVIDGQEGPIALFWFLLQAGVILFALLKAKAGLAPAAALIALALLALVPGPHDGAGLALALAIYGAVFTAWARPDWGRHVALAAAGLGLALAGLVGGTAWIAAAGAAFLVPALSLLPVPWPGRVPAAPAASDGAFVSVLACVLVVAGGLQMAARGGLSMAPQEMRAFVDVQLWARRNTPPGTVFLPVGLSGFSTLSRRPVWADWQSGGNVMWAPEDYAGWWARWSRLKDVASVAAARRLAEEEGVSYIVFDRAVAGPKDAPGDCVAYRNPRFWVLGPCAQAEPASRDGRPADRKD